jgi:hypothetical protein
MTDRYCIVTGATPEELSTAVATKMREGGWMPQLGGLSVAMVYVPAPPVRESSRPGQKAPAREAMGQTVTLYAQALICA